MAGRRGGYKTYRGGGYGGYNAKSYKFTARRKAALKKAQALSARKRKMNRVKVGVMAVGGIGLAVGAVAYMGRNTEVGKNVRRNVADSVMKFHPDKSKFANLKKARATVSPNSKENVRMGGAVSPAGTPNMNAATPSAPPPFTPASGARPRPAVSYTVTVLDPADPATIRQDYQDEEDYKKTAEGSLEKFNSPDIDAEIIADFVSVKPLSKTKARQLLREKSRKMAQAGGTGIKPADRERILNRMIAEGTVSQSTRGARTATRTNPQAVPRTTAPNSGMTQAEIDATLAGTEMPHKPVLGTPGNKGVVGIPGKGGSTNITESIFGGPIPGSKIPTPATPPPYPGKPAASPGTPLPPTAAASRPHPPGGITAQQWHDTWFRRGIAPNTMIGKQITDWDLLGPRKMEHADRARAWLLDIDPRTGKFIKGH